jgi:hypothetical protein
MNATFATPQTATTISMACAWCDEPLALDDAFAATVLRCGSCATAIDIEPVGATSSSASLEVAA